MIYIEPLPNELAPSHEHRSMLIRGCSSEHEHERMLRGEILSSVEATRKNGHPRLHLLARASGMDPREYVRRHSMLPSFRVASHYPATEASTLQRAHKMGLRTQTGDARVCLDCIDADLEGTPISWFKRYHHLIGVDWCIVHKSTLHRIIAAQPFRASPKYWRDKHAVERLPAYTARFPAQGWVQRYIEIALMLSERAQPASCTRLNTLLARRAREAIETAGGGRMLSDLIRDLVPGPWLEAHLVKRHGEGRGRSLRVVDDIGSSLHEVRSGPIYTAMLATLFDTASEALTLIESSAPGCSQAERMRAAA